jgi:Homeodomain-like domain/DDE superfamily endonuclease
MRAGIVVNVTRADRRQLEAIISDRSAPQKHVWRAAIILATADGCGTAEIMRRSGKSKPVVWRWQARFMTQGVEGLTRDKTRKPGKKPLPAATVQNVVGLALGPPPGEATHWTGRMLAKAAGVSLRSVQRILEAHQLAPHRIRMFKLSTDPKFAEKLKDVVGLYVDPPAHAVVLSVDEKSQIQALDRTQPGLPMKPGRAGTMTHDYKRHGTTTLFAALNILDGTVIGRNMQRHRHQEFIRFLNTIEAQVPAGKVIHVVVDNYATTNIRRCGNGWRDIRAGPSTSPQPRHPGSTRSKGFSPSSRASGSSAAYSSPSLTCNSPSTASLPIPTPTPNPSFGRPIQNVFSPLSSAGSKR